MQIGHQGRIGVCALEPADLNSDAALRAVCSTLSDTLGRRDVVALAVVLPVFRGPAVPGPALVDLCHMLGACKYPVVAAVQGPVEGPVLALALAAQYRLGPEGLVFACPEGRHGRLPRGPALVRLVHWVGPHVAWDMVVEGRQIGAEAAVTLGLCDGVTQGDPGTAAVALCRKLVTHGAGAREMRTRTGPVQRTGASALAQAAAQAMEAALTVPMREAVTLGDAVDLGLAQGPEAANLQRLAQAEAACLGPAPQITGLSGADPQSRLGRAIDQAGVTRGPEATLSVHLNPDGSAGVLDAGTSGRVPIALAGASGGVDLLEIGPGPETAQSEARGVAQALGAIPVLGGFGLAQALEDAVLETAEYCVLSGATLQDVDQAMVAAGWAAGPFRLADWTGHRSRIARRAAQSRLRDPRQAFAPMVEHLCAEGHFGGTGPGWTDIPANQLAHRLDAVRAEATIPLRNWGPGEIAETITVALSLAARQLVDRHSEAAITVVALQALGLPRHAGGPLWGLDPEQLETCRARLANADPVLWQSPAARTERWAARSTR